MVTIKRITLSSAFRVGAMIGLITAVIIGLLLVGMQALFFSAFANLASLSSTAYDPNFNASGLTSADMMTAFSVMGLVGSCVFYISYVVFSTIAGGLGGVIWGLAYNLSARWVGGLEIELEPEPGKRKRISEPDTFFD